MKTSLRIAAVFISGLVLVFTQSFANPPEHAKNNKIKKVKQKNLPYGLQKKLQRTGELPPGWQKKIQKGEVVSHEVLENGVILLPPYWKDHPYSKNSDIYEVEDRIIRVNRATNVILDVFK